MRTEGYRNGRNPDGVHVGVRKVMAESPRERRSVEIRRSDGSVMVIDIEVPDLATVLAPPVEAKDRAVIAYAIVSDLYFEAGDEIEEGDVLAALFNDNGTCEIVAPASGVLISLRYEEGDTVTSETVLARVQTDR